METRKKAPAEAPNVTVVIPTHNRAHLVGRAIQSVLQQTYEDFELIVVDDASTDETEEVVAGFDDPRIEYIRHERNRGAPAARNTGIEISSGEYIALLDDDDTWQPEKLERQLTIFESAPRQVGVVCCHYRGASAAGCVDHICTASGDVLQSALQFDSIGCITSGMLIKCEALSGVYPLDESLPGCQDTDLTIVLAAEWEFSFVDEVLVLKCESVESISTSTGKDIGRRMVIAKHDSLYRRFPPSVKRRALAKYHYELGRRMITCRKDHLVGLIALLRSFFLSPSLLFQMLMHYARHRREIQRQKTVAAIHDLSKDHKDVSRSQPER